jgi:hypothetical protein
MVSYSLSITYLTHTLQINVGPNLEPVEGAGRGGGVPPPDHLEEPVAGLLQQHVVVPLHPPQDGGLHQGNRETERILCKFNVYWSSSQPIVATTVKKIAIKPQMTPRKIVKNIWYVLHKSAFYLPQCQPV